MRPSYFKNVRDRRAKTLTPAALSILQNSQQTLRGMEEINRLKQEDADIRPGKEMLSIVTWGARYKEGDPRGTEGAQPTGLFFIDCDHLKEDPKTVGLMEKTLLGLGFVRSDLDRPCSEFSGGWRMRIELAKILLGKPDLLLLDEPTNHLDIESIQWLEQWLLSCGSAVVLVSHDKAFMDNVANRTIEISLGHIYDYQVGYSEFVELRKERHEQQVRAYENQQKMIQDTEDFIERFRYKPTKSVQVQSRIKQLAKLERLEVDVEDTRRLRLRFPPAPRSGDFPLICEDVRKAFGEHVVFDHVTLTLRRGEKVAFVGKNGEGKTTLVRCIMNELTDYTGSLKLGHNVKIGYFAQNQASLLDGEATVFDTIDRVAVGDIRTRIKDILGAFMFGGEESEKRVRFLSGGEKSRLAICSSLTSRRTTWTSRRKMFSKTLFATLTVR